MINLRQPQSRGEAANVANFRFQLFAHSDACGGDSGSGVSDFSTWDAASRLVEGGLLEVPQLATPKSSSGLLAAGLPY